MKNKLIIITLSLFFFISNILPVLSQEVATSSSEVELDIIKENVKKRIESVVRDLRDTNSPQLYKAFIGTLESRTTSSLSVLTLDGIKLASTSAQTSVKQVDPEKDLEIDDVSIGDHIALIGEINPEGVMNVSNIITRENNLETTMNKQVFFGLINTDELDDNKIELTNPNTNDSYAFIITPQTTLETVLQNGQRIDIDKEFLSHSMPALAIYQIALGNQTEKILSLTIRLNPVQEALLISELSPTP